MTLHKCSQTTKAIKASVFQSFCPLPLSSISPHSAKNTSNIRNTDLYQREPSVGASSSLFWKPLGALSSVEGTPTARGQVRGREPAGCRRSRVQPRRWIALQGDPHCLSRTEKTHRRWTDMNPDADSVRPFPICVCLFTALMYTS